MVLLDILRNLLDLPLAVNGMFAQPRLGMLLLNSLGLLSSLAGCYQSWPSALASK